MKTIYTAMLSSIFCYLLFQKSHDTHQPMTKLHLIQIKEFLIDRAFKTSTCEAILKKRLIFKCK